MADYNTGYVPPNAGNPNDDPTSGAGGDGGNGPALSVVPGSPPINVTGQAQPPVTTLPNPMGNTGATSAASGSNPILDYILKNAPQLANLLGGSQAVGQDQAQAQSYTDQANKYGAILNPYGAYRQAGATALANLQADPSSVVNTPGYKFALSQGLGAISNKDNRSFGVGAGSTDVDRMTVAQGLASKTYNDTVAQLSAQAGVGIGPGAAASVYQTGMLGNIAANQAANAAKGATTGNAIGLGAGAAATLAKMFQNSGMSPAQAAALAKQITGGGGVASDNAGNPNADPTSATGGDGGNGPAVSGPGTGWHIDQNGNTVQDDVPNPYQIDPYSYDDNYG